MRRESIRENRGEELFPLVVAKSLHTRSQSVRDQPIVGHFFLFAFEGLILNRAFCFELGNVGL